MSRDFMLILGGGVVSLVTTLVVLLITDWVYRHDQARKADGGTDSRAVPPGALVEERET